MSVCLISSQFHLWLHRVKSFGSKAALFNRQGKQVVLCRRQAVSYTTSSRSKLRLFTQYSSQVLFFFYGQPIVLVRPSWEAVVVDPSPLVSRANLIYSGCRAQNWRSSWTLMLLYIQVFSSVGDMYSFPPKKEMIGHLMNGRRENERKLDVVWCSSI